MADWPEWWGWDLELSSHLFKRMVDRGFSETDLRAMMEGASGFRRAAEPGRWIVEALHDGCPWEVVVEPDMVDQLLVVITAYVADQA